MAPRPAGAANNRRETMTLIDRRRSGDGITPMLMIN